MRVRIRIGNGMKGMEMGTEWESKECFTLQAGLGSMSCNKIDDLNTNT